MRSENLSNPAKPAPQARRWHARARHALTHSLRVRLVALFLVLALAMAGTFLAGMQYALSAGWREAARPLVADYVNTLSAEIGTPPSIERAQALVERLPISVRISGPVVNWSSKPQPPNVEHHKHKGSRDTSHWDDEAPPRFFERTTTDGHHLRFGLSADVWHERPRYIGWATLAALLALTTLAYLRVRRMLRPLDDIRAGAQRFGRGDFGTPIAVRHAHRPDELGELAHTVNTMGADIHQMLEAKRALLLAISHELRSPLTRARLNTELLPETPEVLPARQALLRDLAVMRDLVTDLLESERLAQPHAALQREPTDLVALVADVVANLEGAPHVVQKFPVELPLLLLDRTRMRLLLRNLLDNALRHGAGAQEAPWVEVHNAQDGAVSITVRDFGPGLADDHLPELAQPFYRPEAARTRESGGVGLGLYLCKLVALAHAGSFLVENAHPGLRVCVTLQPEAALR